MKFKLLDLLQMRLKDEVLLDLFETYDVDVVYCYDRLHENMPDAYHASLPRLGLEFIFNSDQILTTLFIKRVDIDGFNPIENDERLIYFSSINDVVRHAGAANLKLKQGEVDAFGKQRVWARLDLDDYAIHYEFINADLSKVTLMTEAP